MSAEEYDKKLVAFREKQKKLAVDDIQLRRSGVVPPRRPTMPTLAPDGKDFVATFPEENNKEALEPLLNVKKVSNQKKQFIDGKWV